MYRRERRRPPDDHDDIAVATLPEGDDLSFSRMQDLLSLTPGNLITHLRKLEDAGT